MSVSKSQIALWAALLFVGFDLLELLISWLLTEAFGVTWSDGAVYPWEFPNVFLVIPFALLLASYFFVRRLNHHMLSYLWLYTIVAITVVLVSASLLESLDPATTLVWWAIALELASLIVLVWFARRISAMSFRHSLLFIALTAVVPSSASFTLSQLHTDPSLAPSLPLYIALWVGVVLMGGLIVWALANIRTVVSTARTVLPPVIAMLLLTVALVALSTTSLYEPVGVLDWVVEMLTAVILSLIVPALAVAVTYAVRVRGRTGSDVQPSSA